MTADLRNEQLLCKMFGVPDSNHIARPRMMKHLEKLHQNIQQLLVELFVTDPRHPMFGELNEQQLLLYRLERLKRGARGYHFSNSSWKLRREQLLYWAKGVCQQVVAFIKRRKAVDIAELAKRYVLFGQDFTFTVAEGILEQHLSPGLTDGTIYDLAVSQRWYFALSLDEYRSGVSRPQMIQAADDIGKGGK